DDDRVRLRVEDGGPGVPPDDVGHIFERFYRVRRPGEGSRRGLGIGLSVVKGLVEAMGGTVRAEASAMGGLAVELDLPAVAAPPLEGDRA
ncbi:MAG: sensor histidine kinase, partial [Candidatus Limnocylindrales bacterium]